MVLATHAFVGAALAQLFPSHPVAAFVAGFTSHFVLDALPHKDYKLISREEDKKNSLNDRFIYNRKSFIDLIKLTIDLGLGFLLAYVVFVYKADSVVLLSTLVGAMAGVLPDALQFVYFNFRHEPLIFLQKFHSNIQNDTKTYHLGILSQLATMALVLIFVRFWIGN